MRLKAILVVLVVAAVVTVTGCGGGGGGGTSGGSTAAGTGSEGTTASSEEGNGTTEASEEEAGGTEAGGEEGGGEAANSGPLTKKEFIAKGEAICQKIPNAFGKVVKVLEAEAKKKGQKATTSALTLKGAVPADYAAIREFEALTPPQGNEQEVEAIISSLEDAAKGLEANPEAELSGPKSPYAEWQKLTKAYGFNFCSTL